MRTAFPVILALAVNTLIGISGCSRQEMGRVDVLAQVGDEVLTVVEFEAQLAMLRERGVTALQPEAMLQEWVEREVWVQRALQAGVMEDAEVRELIRDVLIAKHKERVWTSWLADVEVSDEELKAAYESEKAQHQIPERARLAMLFLEVPVTATAEERLQVRQRMGEARVAIDELSLSDAGFGAIAISYSEDQESRYRGGEIGWLERERYPPRLESIVIETGFSLSAVAEVSQVVEGEKGYYVVKLMERQAAADQPFEKVAPVLSGRLRNEKTERVEAKLADELRDGLRIRVHTERFEAIFANANSSALKPPAIP